MKVIQHGVVILSEGPVQVNGWNIQREASDPADATGEQLVLMAAIPWAQARLAQALRQAVKDALRNQLFRAKMPEPADLKLDS